MTDQEIVERYNERLAIMLEGCPAQSLGNTPEEHERQVKRQAYVDIKRRYAILIMPHSTRPEGPDRVIRNKGPSPDNLTLWSDSDAS